MTEATQISITIEDANTILKWWANAGDEWQPTDRDDQIAARLDFAIELDALQHHD